MMSMIPFEYAVRNLGRNPVRSFGLLGGNAIVVLLVIAAASFVEGMRNSLVSPANHDNVILLAVGSDESIERSEIPSRTAGVVAASISGIRTYGGQPCISPEILAAAIVYIDRNSSREHPATLRGVTPAAFLVHRQVEIIEGRSPQPSANEVIVGTLAAHKLGLPESQLQIGGTLWIDRQEWTIVGRFQAPGTVMAAEIWTPLHDLQVTTKRSGVSCVVVTLGGAEFADLDAFTKMRTDLELAAIPEHEYYSSIMQFYRPVRIMIWTTAMLVAMAGLLGGLNTMYSAFAARVREIGMLQSLGFPRRAIAMSFVQESLLAASAAVLLAVGIGWLIIDGQSVRFSMGVFQLRLNGAVLFSGLLSGLVLGVVGALPPAWRCLRLPIAQALKSA